MIAISSEELENADLIGKYAECPICKMDVLVEDTKEKNPGASNVLYYISHCSKTFLVGLNGKVIYFNR